MRILVYGIHYHPDIIGIPKYTGEMCEWFASRGHDVEVITAKPFYPNWKVADAYKKKSWFTEQRNGVTVNRSPFYVPQNPSAAKKIIHEASFVLSSMKYWIQKLTKRYDVIIGVCPPFHIGFLPLVYSKLKSTPFIFHVQDLQVDIARDLGMIKNKALLSLLFSLERFLFKQATYVSTISEGMRNRILSKGISAENMLHFPNWVDANFITPLPVEESLREELGFALSDKIVLYSGNLGEKQGLENVIEVAKNLQSDPSIKFVFVGMGSGKKMLEEKVANYRLDNVSFFPLQPYEKLSALLAMADVHLVLQKREASDLVMPSKLTSILAAGGCAVITADKGSSLFEVIDQNDMGLLVPTENAEALQKGITKALVSDLSNYRKNARAYSQKYLDKDQILMTLEQQLIHLFAPKEKKQTVES